MRNSISAPAGQGPDLRMVAAMAVIAVIVTIASGTTSLTPLIWNDSTSFISSAVATAGQGHITLESGVQPGYVYFLSTVFRLGGGLREVVFIQQLLWLLCIALLVMAIGQIAPRLFTLALVPVAMYPGIHIYQNLIMAESLYTTAITSSLGLMLLAGHNPRTRAKAGLMAGALALASVAGMLKVQGAAPFIVTVIACGYLAARHSRTLFATVTAIAIGVSVPLIMANQAREGSNDPTSVLFGSKTLFCMHLDIVLSAKTTAPLAQAVFGASASAMLGALQRDLVSTRDQFQTLGFYADECQFDKELDQLGIANNQMGTAGLAKWYRDAFLLAIADQPLKYAQKLVRQITYGLKMSVPPHALGKAYTSVEDRLTIASSSLEKSGYSNHGLVKASSVDPPILALHETFANLTFRALSVVTAAAILLAFVGLLLPAWRMHPGAFGAASAAAIWLAQVSLVAATHTLDIWRYIVPVAPAAVVSLALVAWIIFHLWRGSATSKVPQPTRR